MHYDIILKNETHTRYLTIPHAILGNNDMFFHLEVRAGKKFLLTNPNTLISVLSFQRNAGRRMRFSVTDIIQVKCSSISNLTMLIAGRKAYDITCTDRDYYISVKWSPFFERSLLTVEFYNQQNTSKYDIQIVYTKASNFHTIGYIRCHGTAFVQRKRVVCNYVRQCSYFDDEEDCEHCAHGHIVQLRKNNNIEYRCSCDEGYFGVYCTFRKTIYFSSSFVKGTSILIIVSILIGLGISGFFLKSLYFYVHGRQRLLARGYQEMSRNRETILIDNNHDTITMTNNKIDGLSENDKKVFANQLFLLGIDPADIINGYKSQNFDRNELLPSYDDVTQSGEPRIDDLVLYTVEEKSVDVERMERIIPIQDASRLTAVIVFRPQLNRIEGNVSVENQEDNSNL
ncbi:hypothetical protein SNEBB_008253 [Seison nebaliae]|nr:hypothetical protein SNEBB_008253 [Seison nebaliae]